MIMRVHIERLLIDASLGIDPRALEAALAEGLAQALREQPGLALLQEGRSIAALTTRPIRIHGPAAAWGVQLGQALHAALGGGAMPGQPTGTRGDSP